MIPVTDNVEILRQIVSQLDGIVFTGGEDIQPIYYGDLPYEKLEEVSPPGIPSINGAKMPQTGIFPY